MKAVLKNMMMAYSGKCDGLVYYYNPRLDRVLVRSLPEWTPTSSNRRLSQISSNLKALAISSAFRSDMITYTELYRHEYRDRNCVSWYNLFNKMMWNMTKLYGTDLALLSRAMIEDGDLPCRSIKNAVEGGLLPPVNGWERMDSSI